MHKKGSTVPGKHQFIVCEYTDYFFKRPRMNMYCSSTRLDDKIVEKSGDYIKPFWIKNFFDGEIDMSLQTNTSGCAVLSIEDAEKALQFENPLRDPIVIVKTNDVYSLRDGFHRIHEAYARQYRGRVWTAVLDMDLDTDDTDIDV